MARKKIEIRNIDVSRAVYPVASVGQYFKAVDGKYWFLVRIKNDAYLCETVTDVHRTLRLVAQNIEEGC
jgi:hypothetical protein